MKTILLDIFQTQPPDDGLPRHMAVPPDQIACAITAQDDGRATVLFLKGAKADGSPITALVTQSPRDIALLMERE